MVIKITCPVCDRKEIEENNCPNCETDLSLIRMLLELPLELPNEEKTLGINSRLLLLFAIILLSLGVSLGWLSNANLIK
jgi:hypothetical protein